MNKLDMAGRSAIVTGGAAGIGLAVVQRLAASGADVAIWDVNEQALATAAASVSGVKVHTSKVDITQLDQVEAAFAGTVAALGKVDALVNSAGIAGQNTTVIDYPVEEWLRVFDINTHGTFYCCKTAARHMAGRGYGRIVNIASIAGKEGNPNASAYSASKAAVIGLTKSAALEVARKGIRINAICPGPVDTPMIRDIEEGQAPGNAQALRAQRTATIPDGRYATPEEVANLMLYLVSDLASHVTGQGIQINGGSHG